MKLNHQPGKKAADLKLYALSTCPWCRKTKALLDSLGVEYYWVDVDLLSGAEREEAMATVKKWNPSASFPTMVFNNSKCIIGYREQDIKDALAL